MTGIPAPRILLVDDEPDIREILARALRREYPGCVVEQAKDALEGMARVRLGAFDIVVSDFRMPGDDGVTFLHNVREASPHSIRMLLTGYPDQDSAVRAVNDARLERFLTKPISIQAFLGAIGEAWQAKQASDARMTAFARGFAELRSKVAPPGP